MLNSVNKFLFDGNLSDFVELIPNSIELPDCDIPPKWFKMSSLFVGNSSATQEILTRVAEQSAAMFSLIISNNIFIF